MRNCPVNISREALIGILEDILNRVRAGDSFEGSIEYLLPEDMDAPARSFDVRASYRIGNTMGQGGLRMIGEMREVPDDDNGS
jgi:hypothetical protein